MIHLYNLPPYLYDQYAERVIAMDYQALSNKPVNRIHSILPYNRQPTVQTLEVISKNEKGIASKKERVITDKIYSKITGTGLFINDLI